MSQRNNLEKEPKVLDIEIPIFEAKCINNSSRCKLMYVGCAEKGKVVGDYPIEFNTPKEMVDLIGKNAYSVCEYRQYNVIAKVMCCSINGGYLTQFDTIPCYYMTLLYNSKFGVAGTVVTVGINFVIDNEHLNKISIPYQEEQKKLKLEKKNKKNKITQILKEEISTNDIQTDSDTEDNKQLDDDKKLPPNPNNSTAELKRRTVEINLKKLISSELYGSYYISITCDKDERDDFLNKMKTKCNVNLNTDDKTPENLKNNENYIEYVKMFNPTKLESYPNKNVIIHNKFIKYLKNEKFMEFVYSILDNRINEKVKEVGHLFDHKLPKNIFSYRKLKDNPELVDQMIDDDDRSSNQSSDDEDVVEN